MRMTEKKKDGLKGVIFDVQRYSLHDGEGIRTLVFMKGCPLRCLWCSNPESQNGKIEIGSISKECIGCEKCFEICKKNAIMLPDYSIDRSRCNNCLECAQVCAVKSKRVVGSIVTVDQLLETVEKDRIFFKNSMGGITVGGGEPAFQSEFVSAFLKACKGVNLNTNIETCGYASWESFSKTAQYADVIHFDVKHMDSDRHFKLTGAKNEIILENLEKISEVKDIIVRIPVIPGMNDDDENLYNTIKFASGLKRVIRIELLPFHTLGYGKYDLVGKENSLSEMKSYTKEQKAELAERVKKMTMNVEIRIM